MIKLIGKSYSFKLLKCIFLTKKNFLFFKGDTPKTLAQQFYKDEVVQYLEAVEWDRDHPEQAESNFRIIDI